MTFFKNSRQPDEGGAIVRRTTQRKVDSVTLFARAIGEASPMPFHFTKRAEKSAARYKSRN
jgi:hypothetical protein